MKSLSYYHVDVFTGQPLSGNGLTVFTDAGHLSQTSMQRLTQEMRQFESIFLQVLSPGRIRAFVFTCEEELDFAGHPVLGAAATLHDLSKAREEQAEWTFVLNEKEVSVTTRRNGLGYTAEMNQGKAEFPKVLDTSETRMVLDWMNLSPEDLGGAPQVVSTGLPYLLLPLQKNGIRAKIGIPDLEARMFPWGAKFIGTLEIPTQEIRTWDNAGTVEDIATGSLAGPVGAYLVRHGFRAEGETIVLRQGANLGRPSQLLVRQSAAGIFVSGEVVNVARGVLSKEVSAIL
jgi:trans-2,3-dihydro-3-hydroxyanthranilate isomerase